MEALQLSCLLVASVSAHSRAISALRTTVVPANQMLSLQGAEGFALHRLF